MRRSLVPGCLAFLAKKVRLLGSHMRIIGAELPEILPAMRRDPVASLKLHLCVLVHFTIPSLNVRWRFDRLRDRLLRDKIFGFSRNWFHIQICVQLVEQHLHRPDNLLIPLTPHSFSQFICLPQRQQLNDIWRSFGLCPLLAFVTNYVVTCVV